MAKNPPPLPCIENGPFYPRRLNGSEAVVIIVIVCLGAFLTAVIGLPLAEVVQLLAGVGLVAALVVQLVTGAPQRGLSRVLGALFSPPSG
ncbi:hypothetical protein PV396_44350 [Streptomyces sp. ME02-8801-2C]|uniref:hypothetical protein n=1 Tax=Streptomyces sp. ME02-8801-2C TaxID=3028680 RepID=UPI0029A149E4|nr:hypothetical protein [Streptomyces sp. ME02-8801-2C]MDX3458878.1 hypothetical protein [Streptomyces sp. ME02-8801-2C]